MTGKYIGRTPAGKCACVIDTGFPVNGMGDSLLCAAGGTGDIRLKAAKTKNNNRAYITDFSSFWNYAQLINF